jgi:hypothetical protein
MNTLPYLAYRSLNTAGSPFFKRVGTSARRAIPLTSGGRCPGFLAFENLVDNTMAMKRRAMAPHHTLAKYMLNYLCCNSINMSLEDTTDMHVFLLLL